MAPDEYLLWGRLVSYLVFAGVIKDRAIPWASPVPYCGDPSTAVVATVALNPGHGEFINRVNNEIRGDLRRFHTLRSLRIRSWLEVEAKHLERMDQLCRRYFKRNPYGLWSARIGSVLEHAGYSYETGAACHLPLIPYAIPQSGSKVLPEADVRPMMAAAGPILGRIVRDAPIRLLVLNGDAVIARFERLAGVELAETEQPSWRLSHPLARHNEVFVYQGSATNIGGVDLGREVVLVGCNHSLISRYMDAEVRQIIGEWIGQIEAPSKDLTPLS